MVPYALLNVLYAGSVTSMTTSVSIVGKQICLWWCLCERLLACGVQEAIPETAEDAKDFGDYRGGYRRLHQRCAFLRRQMDPSTLEMLLMLRLNKDMWSEKTLQDIIDDKMAANRGRARLHAHAAEDDDMFE